MRKVIYNLNIFNNTDGVYNVVFSENYDTTAELDTACLDFVGEKKLTIQIIATVNGNPVYNSGKFRIEGLDNALTLSELAVEKVLSDDY